MFLFGKKDESKVKQTAPVEVKKPAAPILDADDFFKDMGRKREQPKDVKSIETPEVQGLREAPAPAPSIIIKNIDTDIVSTDVLADKTVPDPTINYGDINEVVTETMDVDAVFAREAALKEAKANQPEEPKIMVDPDDFFKDMGRRAKRRGDEPIESPEIVGLREAPEEAPVSSIGGLAADDFAVEALRDKSILTGDENPGDIREIDISNIDLSSLRE